MFYEIPASLPNEIEELNAHIHRYLAGEMDAESMRGQRVPFGCYEQRQNGTYMLRIRCPGGALTPTQLRVIATLSKKYGRDSIHITTRQEFQIHEVKLENVVPILRELLNANLATRGSGGNTVRNILVSPEAGISADEVFDPTVYAFALTSQLIAEPDSWTLPRKFKIAFSSSAKDSAFAHFNDLGFIAATKQGERGFRVYVAGGMGAKPEIGRLLHDFIQCEDVYFVAEAVKRVFHKHGNRKDKNSARLRFLWKQLGKDRFRQLYEQQFEELLKEPLRPLELPQESAGSVTPPFRPRKIQEPEFEAWKRRFVSRQRQPGLCSILLPVFLGNLKNADAITLALFLEAFGNNVLRPTMGQNLRLRNIPEEYLGNVYVAVKGISELASTPVLLANAIACAGADTFRLGICLSKGALRAIKDKLAQSQLDLDQVPEFKLNISGCPNTCGQHMIADLGFYGKVGRNGDQIVPAYGVVAGAIVADGKARLARNLGQINARSLPDFVEAVLETWIQKKSRFQSFSAYVDDEGSKDIATICRRYRVTTDSGTDATYWLDWGAETPFSLDGRGPGECSAGPAT